MQRPRFTRDKPKGYFQTKELERTAEAIARVNARWRKLSTLSSMCQHAAALQFFRCAVKNKALSRQHPCFQRRFFFRFAGLPRKAFPLKQAKVDVSVFRWLRKQRPRFTRDKPKGYFQTKELERTTEAIARVNDRWRRLRMLSSMRLHVACSLSAMQRRPSPFRTASFFHEQVCLSKLSHRNKQR